MLRSKSEHTLNIYQLLKKLNKNKILKQNKKNNNKKNTKNFAKLIQCQSRTDWANIFHGLKFF